MGLGAVVLGYWRWLQNTLQLEEQDHWRQGVEHRCRETLCLSKAYTERISKLHEEWWDTLPEALQK